ncbi:uncharacterized protein LOC121645396 isoform X2 [Xyrichtys novacula]|uniref:Uncharacterized protein LOC121645396 isoform X2 n=1 Tax=Xyrichtys novacula TaxID=13765 RepID=A0AAV1FKS3_XYRNO|nr:uncharacterized protein LOC121645396 isoform X2 [Xyrichtys novacula]
MAATTTFPLTSPHRCDGCLEKSQSIAQLERRISDLHWIWNEEKLLDSVVTLGAGPPVNSELNSTIPVWDANSPAASVCQPSPGPGDTLASTGPAASGPPHLQRDDRWLLLGAKPNCVPAAALDFTPHPRHRLRSSTPQQAPWSSVPARKAGGTSPQLPDELQLSNRYEVLSLEDFPPLTREPAAVSERATVSTVAVSGGAPSTEARAGVSLPATSNRSNSRGSCAPCLTCSDSCAPGGKAVFISGPIPTLARGAERFSCLLSLNTWLLSACRDYECPVLLHSTLPPMDLLFTSMTTLFNIPSQYTLAHIITPINTSPPLQVHGPGWL